MLETVDLKARIDKHEYDELMDALDIRLGYLQRQVREAQIPVIIVMEGWDAAGKGTAISRLLQPLDPRGFKVHPISAPNEEEALRPPMWRFWHALPAKGEIALFDRSWYGQVLVERVEKITQKREWQAAYDRIRNFEWQFTDDGGVIVKFFLHISKKEQAKRFKKLEGDPALSWKVTKDDKKRHKNYPRYATAVEDMLRETSVPRTPWTIVPAHDRRYCHFLIADTIAHTLEDALSRKAAPKGRAPRIGKRRTSPLDRVDLTLKTDRETYEKELPKLQAELYRLEHEIYVRRLPVIIVYQGWDAAGKGGNIRRLTNKLDPRGFEVQAFGAPQGDEQSHHYLWRFWRVLPKAGHICIFDRSWYGRVLVERVEKFATPAEWQRAYREINEFEHELVSFGSVVVKFWLHIDKDEQLQRFESRKKRPHKRWKITEEDWRNREKWDDYWYAVSDMIEKTSTIEAPWTIIPGNDKLFARLEALRVITQAIKQRL